MNKLVSSIKEKELNKKTTTANGMKARFSTTDYVVDLFYKIGASRGKDILSEFFDAYNEDSNLALRVVMWSRDIRGGAGERKIYLDIISGLESIGEIESAKKLLNKLPELGRFKDLFHDFENTDLQNQAFKIVSDAIKQKNGLSAKWTPRQGYIANKFRKYLNSTLNLTFNPKDYRKMLVELSNTVEQKISANKWNEVNYSHVPSIAMKNLTKAFKKHDEYRFDEYKTKLLNGTEKINVETLYPYQVLENLSNDNILSHAQWDALPNYLGEQRILPMVDVSGSMLDPVGKNLSAMDVAVSLGLYIATKSSGSLKNTLLSFTDSPTLMVLPEKANLKTKIDLIKKHVGYTTNIVLAYKSLLDFAVKNNVPDEDMPEIILMLSDMQFNAGSITGKDETSLKIIQKLYERTSYKIPKLVYWNLLGYDNVPAKSDSNNVALVSGFSPSIMKTVLAAKTFNPKDVMLDAIMNSRYD